MSNDGVILVFVGSVLGEGVAILPLLMAMTRSAFVGELFMVYVAEESVIRQFDCCNYVYALDFLASTLEKMR